MATGSDPDRPEGEFGELLARVAPVSAAFAEGGHQLHLVGGCVRDALLGAAGSDLDLTTDARPERIKELVAPLADALWTQGERFGTIGARIDGHDVEITTHRSERYDPTSRKPAVTFADALEVDLSRRDFTINAMAVDAGTGALVDPHGGRADLDARLLRTPLAPAESFSDDPLRILRAGRFLPRFELTADPGLTAAARSLVDRLAIVSAERVSDELGKLLGTERPDRGLAFLAEVGVLDLVLPEAGPPVAVDAVEPDPIVRLAALLHRAPGGALGARLRALRFANDDADRVARLVAALEPARADRGPLPDPVVRRWAAAVGPDRAAAIGLASDLGLPGADRLAAAVDRLDDTDLDDLSLPVDGADVMRALDLAPGPEVGAVLAELTEHRLDHGPISRDEALAWLRRRADLGGEGGEPRP